MRCAQILTVVPTPSEADAYYCRYLSPWKDAFGVAVPVCTATVIFNVCCFFHLDQTTFESSQKFYHLTWPVVLVSYIILTVFEHHKSCFTELGQCTFHRSRDGVHVYLPAVISMVMLIIIIGSSVSLRYKLRYGDGSTPRSPSFPNPLSAPALSNTPRQLAPMLSPARPTLSIALR